MVMDEMRKNPVPKGMNRRELKRLIAVLREIRKVATMDNANFFVFDEKSKEKMNEIKALSHVWRTSWIISPLDLLIDRYEEALL
jgi:hypothetical protein